MISDGVKDDKEQKTKALLPPRQKNEGRCYVPKAKGESGAFFGIYGKW